MTDRLHSCKESPDGRHLYAPTGQTPPRFTCRWCGQEYPGLLYGINAGWNAPDIDPDAHLGTVGGE